MVRSAGANAVLVACGDSVTAAVAPATEMDAAAAASIAFMAVLSVAVVLGLPPFGAGPSLSQLRFGALAGLTVYAVPQVLAAASPVGPAAVQIGTPVKLVRVSMPRAVMLALSLLAARLLNASPGRPQPCTASNHSVRSPRRFQCSTHSAGIPS